MAIHFIEEDRNPKGLKRAEIKEWLKKVVHAEKMKLGIINFVFCSDGYLLDVNKQFLGKDYFTDVISFDYSEKGTVGGDIMISIDRVEENARVMGVPFPEELNRVMVHGVLHLIGYKDHTGENKSVMTGLENLYLGMVGKSNEN